MTEGDRYIDEKKAELSKKRASPRYQVTCSKNNARTSRQKQQSHGIHGNPGNLLVEWTVDWFLIKQGIRSYHICGVQKRGRVEVENEDELAMSFERRAIA